MEKEQGDTGVFDQRIATISQSLNQVNRLNVVNMLIYRRTIPQEIGDPVHMQKPDQRIYFLPVKCSVEHSILPPKERFSRHSLLGDSIHHRFLQEAGRWIKYLNPMPYLTAT